MEIEEPKIIDHKLILPKRLLTSLKWKYPFHRIPKLKEYSQGIIEYAKEKNKLPFYAKFDINNDGKEEILLIQRSIIGGYGRVLIISSDGGKYKFETVKWRRPVNALFFDYSIMIAKPRNYNTFGFILEDEDENNQNLPISKKIEVKYPHLITDGYLTRVVYWDDMKFCQEWVSFLINR